FDNGTPHIVYRDLNNHLQLLFQENGVWQKRQITQGDDQRAKSDPSVYEFGTIHIIYQGWDDQMREILLDRGELTYFRITDGDAQKIAGRPVGFVREGAQHIVYRQPDGNINHMRFENERWVHNQLIGAEDMLAAGDPQLHFWGTQHFLYRGQDGHLHELVVNLEGWDNFQLTFGDEQKMAGDGIGFGTVLDKPWQMVVYRTPSGQLNTVSFVNGIWTHNVLDTSLAPQAAADSKFSTYFYGAQHILYKTAQGEIQELVLTSNGWESYAPIFLDQAQLNSSPAGFAHISTYPTPPSFLLKTLADKYDLELGVTVNQSVFENDPVYRQMLVEQFNIVSNENILKFGPIHPEQDRYDFENADELVQFVQDNSMTMRGHALVWHTQQPAWLEFGGWNREEMIEILEDHIATVVGRYAGKIKYWDVVNEAIDEDTNQMRETFWLETIGPDYLDIAFHAARAADPDAILIYNDYGNSHINPKSDAIYEMIVGMLNRGVPIDGVGFQLHISTHLPFDIDSIRANMDLFAALGLKVQFTEIDVRIWQNTSALPNRLVDQAQRYHDLLELCIEHPACETYQMWGFTDGVTWVYDFFGGEYPFEAPLPWDVDYRPKPAYYALVDAMAPNATAAYLPYIQQ
ncbi:MAG: endo-1,4-beta-xylanase, partial [Chloroflexota bacterium]